MLRMTEQQWDAVIAVNLKSAFNFIHACVPVMMRQRGGSIINMASVVGVHGNAGQANYAASKAGLIALAKSIGQEMGPKGIRANAIAPGFIDTAMTQALPDDIRKEWINKIPLRRGGQVEDIANVATFLASDMSSYVELRQRSGDPGRWRYEYVKPHPSPKGRGLMNYESHLRGQPYYHRQQTERGDCTGRQDWRSSPL